MKWTEKKKRNLTVAGGIVLGVILVAAIAVQFGKAPVTGVDLCQYFGESMRKFL